MASLDRQPILVVEDDPDLRQALCELLSDREVEARGVPDGQQAVYYLMVEPPPRAIVLDLRLPLLNGWDLLAWVRGEPACRDVPVVVLSGAPVERVELALEHAPVAWLLKPVDPRALRRAVAGL
ncbi:MAG: response regulator [Planctomycetes bacterium]|nr:response regulator [Planctomycetota bacterium]